MWNQNVVQAGQKPPHEEQGGDDGQRTRIIWGRRNRRATLCRPKTNGNFSSCHISNLTFRLKPRFGLYAVRQSVRPVHKWHSPHEAAEPIRPVCVGQKSAQDRPAEELSACSDLRRNGKLAQPAIVLTAKARVVESTLERQGEMLGEKDFRSGAKRHPLVPAVLRITIFVLLVDEDWHDGEPFARLKEHLFHG